MASTTRTLARGRSFPLGGTPTKDGVLFAVYAPRAERVDVLLFDGPEATAPSETIALDPGQHRTYRYWHCLVPGLRAGQVYAYRADGPHDPGAGIRFDPEKVLLDPYAKAIVMPSGYRRGDACRPGPNDATALRSVVVDPAEFDWGEERRPRTPYSRSVIYELHVRGFTRHPSSGVAPALAGSYLGLVERIPHLVDLGITAVELLPVFAFDPQDAPDGLVNYWGYSPVSFFAPHPAYASPAARGDPIAALREFRGMVRSLHEAGIEVILDVVFNHTAEGNEQGPTQCFRGLANDAYYLLDQGDRARYADYAGCGNTLNAHHPVVRRMIRDSLHWWVQAMGIDGFRFDLASILSRDDRGVPRPDPPVLLDIESDPILCNTKLIAEAWDASGLSQVGSFAGETWKEWNGHFRDDVRRFLRGDPGAVRALPSRIVGSPDLYERRGREPEVGVNFVTCHDGFTLLDLVSYDERHNEANREGNRDGSPFNLSWNCGIEGPSDDPAIVALRARQRRNFLALTLLSIGTPMLLMGDECGRTQSGNNNAWCQDNETSWLDWSLVERNADLVRFVRELVRRRTVGGRPDEPGLTLGELLRRAEIRWHGTKLETPDWSDGARAIALETRSVGRAFTVFAMLNAWCDPLEFELPPGPWRRWLDTSLLPPEEVNDGLSAPPVDGSSYRVMAHSIVYLFRASGDGMPR